MIGEKAAAMIVPLEVDAAHDHPGNKPLLKRHIRRAEPHRGDMMMAVDEAGRDELASGPDHRQIGVSVPPTGVGSDRGYDAVLCTTAPAAISFQQWRSSPLVIIVRLCISDPDIAALLVGAGTISAEWQCAHLAFGPAGRGSHSTCRWFDLT